MIHCYKQFEAKSRIRWYKDGKFQDDEKPSEIEEEKDNEIIHSKEFTDFLKEKGSYDNFVRESLKHIIKKGERIDISGSGIDIINNYIKRILDAHTKVKVLDIINFCIYWADTKQGAAYWSDLNDDWIHYHNLYVKRHGDEINESNTTTENWISEMLKSPNVSDYEEEEDYIDFHDYLNDINEPDIMCIKVHIEDWDKLATELEKEGYVWGNCQRPKDVTPTMDRTHNYYLICLYNDKKIYYGSEDKIIEY